MKLENKLIGRRIKSITFSEFSDSACLQFFDGSSLRIFDDGQSCCETRYMSTEEPLDYWTKETPIYMGYEIVDMDDGGQEDDYGWHEQQALNILTSKGSIQFVTHNEHNGYYGGFIIRTECSVAEPIAYNPNQESEDDCL